MTSGIKDSIWWPKLFKDINMPKIPQDPLPDVHCLFQQVCSDYRQVAGKNCLVLVDRYLMVRTKKASEAELVTSIRELF